MMAERKKYVSNLNIRKGIEQPPDINPVVFGGKKKLRKKYSEDEYFAGIIEGNRTILSQAITLAESSLPENYDTIQAIIEKCLPYSGNSVRIGITGVPGAGKSTLIEVFGLHIISAGHKVAVLAVDPSSSRSKGSILGDKTRMQKLSIHPDAFIRPSPSAGTPGGVTRKTRDAIILCEAAGFDTILVETVGVGQSETAVHSMVDFFVLLMIAGAGDELQGIKRGIIEMADAIVITKADGSDKLKAEKAKLLYQNVLTLFSAQPSGWKPAVLTCSALENSGISELWDLINEYVSFAKKNGYFDERRKQQSVISMNDTITEYLNNSFNNNKDVKLLKPLLEKQLYEGRISSCKAAMNLIDKYIKS